MVLGQRAPIDTYVESCYYIIKAEPGLWHDSSQIYIYLNQSSNAVMNVFSGTNRNNASLVIEQNQTVPVGTPIRIPYTSDAIITLRVDKLTSSNASASFSYLVVGTKYKWFEIPFIGQPYWYYVSF